MAGLLYKLSTRMLVSFGLLFVLMLAAVELVYLYGIPFSDYVGQYAEHRSTVFNQLNLVADLKAKRIKQWFEERKSDTKVIAESRMMHFDLKEFTALLREYEDRGLEGEALLDEAIRSESYKRLFLHMVLVKNTYAIYHSIHIVDVASKAVIVSTNAREYGVAALWDEKVLSDIATGDFVIYFQSAKDIRHDENIISIYYPLSYDGDPEQEGSGIDYVLEMHIDVDNFIRPVLQDVKGLGKTGEVLLVNQEVKIITPLKHPLADGSIAEPLEYRIDAKPAIFAARGEGGLIKEVDYRGVPVLAAYRHIRLTSEMGLGLVVKRDISEVFAPLRRNIVYTTSAGLTVMFLSLFATYFIARNIAHPLKNVDRAARDIRSGRLEARADVVSDDEVGSVATTFNAMAEQVEQWKDELEQQVAARTIELTEEIRERARAESDIRKWAKAFELAEWGIVIGGSKDKQSIDQMNPAYARMHGYTVDELIGHKASELYSPEDRDKISGNLLIAREKGSHTFEINRLRKDGSTFPSLTSITAIKDSDGETMYYAVNVLDITERKLAEADIQRWTKVFENAEWGVVVVGSKGPTLDLANPAYARMHGYTIDELIGRNAADLYSPEDRDKISGNRLIAQEKGSHTFEVKRLRKDGSTFPSLNTITAIRDADGEMMYYAVNVLDITEHKRAEEAINDSQEQINLLLDSTAEGIYGLDLEGNCTMCNASCLSILGYKSEKDLIGRNMHELIHHTRPDGTEYPGVECKIYKTLRDGTGMHCSDEVFWCASGLSFDAEYWSYPIKKNGKVIGAVVTFLNITERKLAEESLRKLTHALGERVKELNCQYSISKLDERPGVSLDEIIQGVADNIPPGWHYPDITCAMITINEKEYKTANFQETDWKQSSEIYAQGVRIGSLTVCYLEQMPGLDEGPFLKEERELIDTIAKNLGRTIDRKRAEDEILKLNKELEHRVRERTAQLEAANQELESFAYSVSHDLRAPLRSIDGFSQAIVKKYSESMDDEAIDLFMRVRAATQRMAELIENMLELSRLSRTEMSMAEVDLTGLVKKVVEDLRNTEPGRNVSFEIMDGLSARGDRKLMQAVLENLLGNAWKFTSGKDKAKVEFGTRKGIDGKPVFYVRDNGAGFDMTYSDKLFGPFQRLHSAEEFPGTGVGLASVKRVIARHGGKVWAEGQVGKGATFYFTLG